MNKGDIVKITRFGRCPINPPMWGVLIDDDDRAPGIGLFIYYLKHLDRIGETVDDLCLDYQEDTWEVVPLDELPDKVLAKYTSWILLGETNNE